MSKDIDRSILTNSIGWTMYHDDGREVTTTIDGVPLITITEVELARCNAAVDRILRDLKRG